MRIDAHKDFGRRECPSCAVEVPANNNRCPICGYEFTHPTPARKYLNVWGALLLLAILLAILLV